MTRQRDSVKIIIVGAGIAGLSTYLFLQKYCASLVDLNITIYESYKPGSKRSLAEATFQELSSSSQIVGGAIGLSPNGMRILGELDEDLHDRIKAAGFVVEKFVFKSARGWRLLVSPTSDMRGKKGNPPGEEEFCLSVSRQAVRDHILDGVGPEKIVYKKVVKARKARPSEGKKATVVFEDGSEDEADLVIGADGVQSEVLRGIFADEEMVKPHYESVSSDVSIFRANLRVEASLESAVSLMAQFPTRSKKRSPCASSSAPLDSSAMLQLLQIPQCGGLRVKRKMSQHREQSPRRK